MTEPSKIIRDRACGVLRTVALIGILSWALWMAPDAFAQSATDAAVSSEPTKKSLLDLYLTGGPLMHFILLCSIGTIAVTVYCFIQINPAKMMPKAQVGVMTSYMKSRDASSAYEVCAQNPNTFADTFASALLKVNFERPMANKLSMEQASAETLGQEETRYMTWINYLNVFATLAPMLGLLGTVTGMIQAFDKLNAGLSEPQDLAGGIGEAMVTTAAGLIVGIPAMFFYFFFRNRLMMIVSQIQKAVTFLIDILSGELQIEGAVDTAGQPLAAEAAQELRS